MIAPLAVVLDCPDPTLYPCSHMGCALAATIVEIHTWGTTGIGFYGYCKTHAHVEEAAR